MKYLFTIIAFTLGFNSSLFSQINYYVDATNGNDTNNGLTDTTAWKTLSKVNSKTFLPNDSILFKAGETFIGELNPQGSGTAGNPINIDKYGLGSKPIFDAQGFVTTAYNFSASIRLYNQEYWHISNLKVKNFEINGNIAGDKMFGILIEARDAGTLHGFKITNTEVYDVNGDLNSRKNGGLAFKVTRSNSGNEVSTNFDGILIENCMFHDVSNVGVMTSSDWDTRDLTSSFGQTTIDNKTNDWFPSLNIVVRNNDFSNIHGNGMVIRVADGPLVEYNKFYKCGLLTTGNASYPYNCDNALWQYNEASHTVYNPGDADASGFDSDYFCKNTIIQYNYSHDNDYGSLLITSNGGLSRAFNDGTIIRYNIFQNDGHHIIRVSGKPTNSYIYNNTIYVDSLLTGTMEILWHKNWLGYPDSTFYFNNIFEIHKAGAIYNFGQSTNNFFENNIFYGINPSSEPNDPNKITTDPLLLAPGTGNFGFSTLNGYQIQAGSPAIDAGKSITNNTALDFYGNSSLNGPIDVGAHEYFNITSNKEVDIPNKSITIYPNPLGENMLSINLNECNNCSNVNVTIISILGKTVYNEDIKTSRNRIDIRTNEILSTGIYVVNVKTKSSIFSKKLMVK
jgi:hypothetical protein